MKRIPLQLLLSVLAAAAQARATREEQACDCAGCKFSAATESLLAARKAYAAAEAKANQTVNEAQTARDEQEIAKNELRAAQAAFEIAADDLNAEDARSEGGVQ